MSVTVPLAYPAAIPVGHRVELTWFVKLAGMRAYKPSSRPFEPHLRDLDSGVAYGAEWQLGSVRRLPLRPPSTPTSPSRCRGCRSSGRCAAASLACTVVPVRLPNPYQNTLLLLDEER